MSRLPSSSMGAAAPAEYIRLADRALATGTVITGDGVLAVPDLVLIEGAAHQLEIPPTFTLLRDDARSISFYRWTGRAV